MEPKGLVKKERLRGPPSAPRNWGTRGWRNCCTALRILCRPSRHSSEMLFPFSFRPDSSTEVGMDVYLQSKTLDRAKGVSLLNQPP